MVFSRRGAKDESDGGNELFPGVFVLALTSHQATAQDQALAKLQAEAMRLRLDPPKPGSGDFRGAIAPLHAALRDWVESKLPSDLKRLEVQFPDLEQRLDYELNAAKLDPSTAPNPADDDPEGVPFGYVRIHLQRFAELSDSLFVTASVSMPCGADQAVYMYRFDANGWKPVIEDGGSSGHGDAKIELSEPDSRGRRLVLTRRTSVQCASFWMGMDYSVYRIDPAGGAATATKLMSQQHGFWFGDDGPSFLLKPDELMLEFRDWSVSADVHNRTEIERFNFERGVHRLDPVAFQPQDFAEEWLTRPWSEMQSRSAAGTEEWHRRLNNDFVLGDYVAVSQCKSTKSLWSIGLDISNIGEKKLAEPLRVFLAMRDLGDYRYRMETVGASPREGCDGDGVPSDKHPWLSEEELRKLR